MSESHTTPESAVTLIDVEEFARSLRAQGTPWSQGCANVLEKLWEQYLYELRCNIALSETTYSTTNAAPQDAPGRKAGDGTGEAAETRQADGIGHSVTSGRRDLRAAAADPGCDVRENPGTTPAGAAPALPDKERDAHTALVHEVCDRIKFFERDVHCFRCSPNVETPYGKGTPGCFAMANETVSIVLRSQEALALSAGERLPSDQFARTLKVNSIIEAAWARDADRLALALVSEPATAAEIAGSTEIPAVKSALSAIKGRS